MCKARSAKFSRHMNQSSGLNILSANELGQLKCLPPGLNDKLGMGR